MPRLTTAEAVIDSLIAHGITTLFALPGVHNDPLFDAAFKAQDRLRVLHPRHEQTAGYMALGAALVSGRPQAFAVVPGPGVLNAATPLLMAQSMCAPVLALAGQIPSFAIDQGHGHLHEIHDQPGLLRHITKGADRIRAPGEAFSKMGHAIDLATSGRPGAVALECAIDVWGQAAETTPRPPIRTQPPGADPAAVQDAAALLRQATRPLIVVGAGALDAGAETQAIAELLRAPVMSFRRGRGVIPTTHPLAVSMTEGHALWKTADVVLGIGTRLYWPQSNWGVDDALRIIRLDIDPDEIARFRHPACALLGDASVTLRALLAALRNDDANWQPNPDLPAIRAAFADRMARQEPVMGFLRAIRAALPVDGLFLEDVTQAGFGARLGFTVHAPRTYFSPGYQDALGWGYGAALGAQAAAPGRKVVLATGDGGFLFQAAELATAMRHGLPVVAVVFDDGAFGNVRRIQAHQYGNRLIASDLANPDFVAFARSFGAAAYRADSPDALEDVLRRAFAADVPAVVHVPVGEMPSPWDMILLPRVRGPAGRPALP